ncbi:unnamed protein product [Discosporangium mesarthrocarpum]
MINQSFYSNIDLIKCPIITEKANRLLESNQYTFLVDPKITKTKIKTVIEFLFNVKVIKINSCNLPKKTRRVNKNIGVKPRYKKVIIKLAKGNTINLFSKN